MLSKVVIVGALFNGEGSLLKRAQDSAASSVKRIVQPIIEMTHDEKEDLKRYRSPFKPKSSEKPLVCDIAEFGIDLDVIKANYTAAIDAGHRNYQTFQPMGCNSINLEDPAVKTVAYKKVVSADKQEKMTPSICFGFAASVCGAQFFAIKNGDECHAITAWTSAPSSDGNCRSQCPGDRSIMGCGSPAVPFLYKMVYHKDSREELEDVVRWTCRGVSFMLGEAADFAKNTGKEMIKSTNCASKSGSIAGDPNTGKVHKFALESTTNVIGKLTQGTDAVDILENKEALDAALDEYQEKFTSSNAIKKEELSANILKTCSVNSDTMGKLQDQAKLIKGFGTYNQNSGSFQGCYYGTAATQRVSGVLPVSLTPASGVVDLLGSQPLDFYLQFCKDAGYQLMGCQGKFCDCISNLPTNGKAPDLCDMKVPGSHTPSGQPGISVAIIEIGGPPPAQPLDKQFANIACEAGKSECAAEQRSASTTCSFEKEDVIGFNTYKTPENCQNDCATDPACVGLQLLKGHGGDLTLNLHSCTRFKKIKGMSLFSSASETCAATETKCYVKKVLQNMIAASHRNVYKPEMCYKDECATSP